MVVVVAVGGGMGGGVLPLKSGVAGSAVLFEYPKLRSVVCREQQP